MAAFFAIVLSPVAYPLGKLLIAVWPKLLHATKEHKDKRCPYERDSNIVHPEKEQFKYHIILMGRSTEASMPHFVCVSLVGSYFLTLGFIGVFWD